MTDPQERMRILERLERGEISPDEAAALLQSEDAGRRKSPSTPMEVLEQLERGEIDADQAAALLQRGRPRPKAHAQVHVHEHARAGGDEPSNRGPQVRQAQGDLPPDFERARQWWILPVLAGVVLMALAGLWMQSIIVQSSFGLLFLCAWIPLLIGLLLIVVGWYSQSGTWLHVRVHPHQPNAPERIAISMPLPLGPATWFMRNFGVRIQGVDADNIDEILAAVEASGKAGTPLHVVVDEVDRGGAYVEVFIG